MDLPTIEFYNNHAQQYVNQTSKISMHHIYDHFLPLIFPGGHILDAGCGSCRDSAFFQSKGFQITAFDASISLVKIAQNTLTFPIHCATFKSFTTTDNYDAIWASASLLHLHKNEIQNTLVKLKGLLKPNGFFDCSFKVNQQFRIDDKGRFFTEMTPTILKNLLLIHFKNVTTFISQGERNDVWCNAIGNNFIDIF